MKGRCCREEEGCSEWEVDGCDCNVERKDWEEDGRCFWEERCSRDRGGVGDCCRFEQEDEAKGGCLSAWVRAEARLWRKALGEKPWQSAPPC